MSQIKNPMLNTDSYKVSMWKQYPPGTESVFSYIESRGGRYDETVFFGLQMFIKEYLMTPFTQAQIDFADRFYKAHGEPFNREGWQAILDKYQGYLPVRIRGLKEGVVIKNQNALVTVENIDPEFYWVTTWVETALLRAVWYPVTVASQSFSIKRVIKRYLEETGDVAGLNFKLHDFGARGATSLESAAIGGAAHLVNFLGSDTISGIVALMEYYNSDVCGYSIPAAEHSTITSWLRENEVEAYRNMIKQFGGSFPLFAVVSDSYNVYEAGKIWGTVLYEAVRDSGSMLVVRPDSGDPATIVGGLDFEDVDNLDDYTLLNARKTIVRNREDGKFYRAEGYDSGWTTKFDIEPLSEEEVKGMIGVLADNFGYDINEKGYKVLRNVRIIQGDGINEESIVEILENLKRGGWSADNVAFGMGGALLQQVNRDTNKFAMKCSAAKVDDEWRDVFKDPITDSGKRSKKGRLTTVEREGDFCTIRIEDLQAYEQDGWKDAMVVYYVAGKLMVDDNIGAIRERAASYL